MHKEVFPEGCEIGQKSSHRLIDHCQTKPFMLLLMVTKSSLLIFLMHF